jgi:hypothetical protein
VVDDLVHFQVRVPFDTIARSILARGPAVLKTWIVPIVYSSRTKQVKLIWIKKKKLRKQTKSRRMILDIPDQ